MVLLGVLGGGETTNKVDFVEEEAFGGLSFTFFNLPDLLLPVGKSVTEASGSVSFEILVFSGQKRTLTW